MLVYRGMVGAITLADVPNISARTKEEVEEIFS